MSKMQKSSIVVNSCLMLLVASILYSCITEYTPKEKGINNILVVEGLITNDATTIRLCRSIDLNSDIKESVIIKDAVLFVECSNGNLFQNVNYIGNGRYVIQTGELEFDKQYRLRIKVGGHEYQSEYLYPEKTPAVDSIFAVKERQGAPVNMYVSTHDNENPTASSYYLWSYKEHWEVKAEFFANAYHEDIYDPENSPIIMADLTTSNNRYYCWSKDSSNTFILGTSEKLMENIIPQQKLLSINPSWYKLSQLYYLKVSQNKVRKEAYDYFMNVKNNTEQTGGLFAPIPGEIPGNITCITDPELPIIGYVDVTITAYADRFFSVLEHDLYERPAVIKGDVGEEEDCKDSGAFISTNYPLPFAPLPTAGRPMYVIGAYNEFLKGITELAYRYCADCRFSGNATKERPDFWPNDHY